MGNEKDDVIVRLNWLSKNFANKKKIWVKRSKKDFADKVFSICTDALGLLIEQKAEIERLKAEVEKAYVSGQNNILEAQAEGR